MKVDGPHLPTGYEHELRGSNELLALSIDAVGIALAELNPAGQEKLAQLAWQDEGQAREQLSKSFIHSAYVAGLVHGVLQEASLGGLHNVGVLSAMTHDLGKSREAIREIVASDKELTPHTRVIMDNHGQYGYEDLEGLVRSKVSELVARTVAKNHCHQILPRQFNSRLEQELNQFVGLVQVADKAQAILLDWRGRPYKARRMRREGLLNEDYQINTEAARVTILGTNADLEFLGIKPEAVVNLAVAHMPSQKWIQENMTAVAERTDDQSAAG